MMDFKSSLDEPIEKFMTKDFAVLDENLTIVEASKHMKARSLESVLVSRKDEIVGIITEKDVLYKVVAEGKNPSKTKVKEVMTFPVISMPSNTSVRKAIEFMVKKGFRRLAVRDDGKIVGMIYQRFMIGAEASGKALLPELEVPKGVRCPYCDTMLDDPEQLSKHIDRIHLGSGLLEGDTRKW